jgi:biotin synthase
MLTQFTAVPMLKHDWTNEEVHALYMQPFPNLIYQAQSIHRAFFPGNRIQRSTLLSAKTGGCSEDCGYCSQSAHHQTGVKEHNLVSLDAVLEKAKEAKASGSTRMCLGAAWREVKTDADFDRVLQMAKEVTALGLEVCCTLGMLSMEQALRLKEAGCNYYNHNLDTSPAYYPKVVTTHSYEDRLNTLRNVRKAGLKLCCGGIIGMGESREDRTSLLVALANQDPHPDSVPINMLVPVEGTPLAALTTKLDLFEFVRTIATARIIMPRSFVRLSAGRLEMSDEAQALCFVAGANSIFAGEKLLTTPNPSEDHDQQLIGRLGLTFMTESELQALDKPTKNAG